MTTSGQTRRDSQKGKKDFSRHQGFTIIELMVVIAIVAVITAFALPSYRTLIEKRQVTSGAEQISAFLSAAQMEAIKRNEQIAIWRDLAEECMGFYSYDPANPRNDCDCTLNDPDATDACAIDELGDGAMGLHVLNKSQLNSNSNPLNKPFQITAINLGGGDELVIFDPVRGMLVPDDRVLMPLEVKLLSKHETYALNVQLAATGRVTVCSDMTVADIKVPSYDECG
jgi:prepilin-type N-terminal cleavage/methylation domain-containing protein